MLFSRFNVESFDAVGWKCAILLQSVGCKDLGSRDCEGSVV